MLYLVRQHFNNMIIHNMEQCTPEWFNVRKGKMTASHAQAIGSAGAGLKTYLKDVLAEYYANAEKRTFNNVHTDAGNELEPQARAIYGMDNGVDVEEVGFIEHSEFAGCSPDGLIGEDGMLEIKCPDNKEYFQHLLHKEKAIPSKYIWQMQAQMMMAGRSWCDYVAYNPNFDTSKVQIRIYADQAKFKKLEVGLLMGAEEISAVKKVMGIKEHNIKTAENRDSIDEKINQEVNDNLADDAGEMS